MEEGDIVYVFVDGHGHRPRVFLPIDVMDVGEVGSQAFLPSGVVCTRGVVGDFS